MARQVSLGVGAKRRRGGVGCGLGVTLRVGVGVAVADALWGVFPSLILLRDFSAKVAKNLCKIRKKLIAARFSGSKVPVKQNIPHQKMIVWEARRCGRLA